MQRRKPILLLIGSIVWQRGSNANLSHRWLDQVLKIATGSVYGRVAMLNFAFATQKI